MHAPALAASPDIDFVGVWTRRPAAAKELAERYGVRAFAEFSDLLASTSAVSFAVPPAVQSELGTVAAKVGKSVLLEVPIGWDLAGAEELAEAVVAAGVISQVALTWRYIDPVRKFLATQETRPVRANGRVVRARPAPPQQISLWRRARGLLFDVGPHVTDFLDAALGPIVDVDAAAEGDDAVRLTLEHRLVGSSESSLSESTSIDYHIAEFKFTGSTGSTVVDCSAAEITADYATMFAEFARAVATKKAHELDVNHGLHIQRVIEAADSAVLLGR
ncbi:MAG: putative oxidoreductase protein [Propionibacteriaceae bacterium]|nr:putative oxidoreductase protein [Propionibacteriaceae bacterium]